MNLFWLRPSPMQVWAVDTNEIQITWGDLPAGLISASAADSRIEVDHAGGAGALTLTDLPAGTELEVVVRTEGGRYERLRATTLTPPPGEVLTKVATMSDLHLGASNWGFLKTISDIGDHADHYDLRCATAAGREARAWGMDLLLLKGDAAHHRRDRDYERVGTFVDRFCEVDMLLVAGNHDVDNKTDLELPKTVGERRLPYSRGVTIRDLPGIRVIAADTTIDGLGRGTLDGVADGIVEAAAETPPESIAFIALHHQMQRFRVATYWPPGISGPEASAFLKRVASSGSRAVVTSGHTHRNRSRQSHGLTLTEVGSPKDWPGVWAAYTVYEGGLTQVVRRVAAPAAIAWTEYSRKALFGLWAPWSPGTLRQRCLSLTI